MADLLALQRDFAAALRGTAAPTCADHALAGDADSIARRLSIYRTNVAASAEKALRAAYPVVAQVVGDEFFGGLAREHLRATPSRSGDLNEYGAAFPDFLAAFAPTRSLPYLPDLARVEWAVHLAEGAADAEPLDPAALAAIPADCQDAIVFAWAPGTASVESRYPLARIWALHQPNPDAEHHTEHEPDFRVDWSVAEPVLVARAGFKVTVTALSPGEAAFFRHALGAAPLGIATNEAFAADAAFDLGALLAHVLRAGLITGVTTHPPSKDPR